MLAKFKLSLFVVMDPLRSAGPIMVQAPIAVLGTQFAVLKSNCGLILVSLTLRDTFWS